MHKDFYDSELNPLNNVIGSSHDFVEHALRLNKDNHPLPTGQFIERLASSEIALHISRRSSNDIQILINDLARRYEEYGSAFSHKFKQFAKRDNLIIGVAVALFLNVNVIALTKTFLDNRGLTESLVSKSEAILESAIVQQERMQKFVIEEFDAKEVAEFKISVERLQKTVEEAKGLDLPLGLFRNVLSSITPGKSKAAEAKVNKAVAEDYVIQFTNAHVAANIGKAATAYSSPLKPLAPSNI